MIDLRQLDRLDFAGKDVTVVGLGIEGVDLARYLARRGSYVTVSDSKPADKLADRIADVGDLGVNLALGANNDRAIIGAEALFVSQSVPLDLPALAKARERGVPLYSMVQLFLELAPGPVIGITGSSGKTTTTALVERMLRADDRDVFVGGNIGVGLMDRLEDIRPYTWSVLEISHTQLQVGDRSPHIAAVLNITPNHLDRFTWDEYRELKANLVRHQTSEDVAILNADDRETRALEPLVRGRLIWFTMKNRLPGRNGVFVRDGWVIGRCEGIEQPLFHLDSVALRGRHNQENAVAAAAIALACGASAGAIASAVEGFTGVPHRLEFVGDADGVRYYNDSIATTPKRTVAGLRSFSEPIVLLLGGRDKNLQMDELANEAIERCRGVVVFGEAAGKLEQALETAATGSRNVSVLRVKRLEEAVAAARDIAEAGDVVLMSPACTSYDAYDNFEQRGEHFRALVEEFAREVQPSLP